MVERSGALSFVAFGRKRNVNPNPRLWYHGTTWEAVKSMVYVTGGRMTRGWLASDINYAHNYVRDVMLVFDFSSEPGKMDEYFTFGSERSWPVSVKKPLPLTFLAEEAKRTIINRLERELIGAENRETLLGQAKKVLFG